MYATFVFSFLGKKITKLKRRGDIKIGGTSNLTQYNPNGNTS